MKSNEVDVATLTVLGDFQEIDDAEKARCAGKLRGDIGQTDGLDRFNFDLAFFHAVTLAGLDVRTGPDANAAGNFTAPHAIAETFGEDHSCIFSEPRSTSASCEFEEGPVRSVGRDEPGARCADMNVGAGGLSRDGHAECKKRDSVLLEVTHEPLALGLIGVNRHVNASAMIEAK